MVTFVLYLKVKYRGVLGVVATSNIHTSGHPQQEHETSHGSMSKTQWAIAGPDNTVLELDGHKFGFNDEGAPMLCSQICRNMGRHVHIDYCRATSAETCNHSGTQHIMELMSPHPTRLKDWVTHGLSWSRLGWSFFNLSTNLLTCISPQVSRVC